jgi:AmiR/NasT family two-component response regulator
VSAKVARAHAERNLRRAAQSRNLVAQAQGMLMERYRLTPQQSFAVLRCISTDQNLQIDAVAEDLVRTGKLPAPTVIATNAERKVAEPD